MNIQEIADRLLRARETAQPVADLPVPSSLEEAYAVQDRMAAAVGEIGGWKIGASGPSDEPMFAPMPRAWMRATPVQSRLRGVEVEIAFQLGRDLPVREEPYSREDVLSAVSGAHPVLEIIESGLPDPLAVPRLLLMADLQINGGFVTGPAIPNWRALDWSSETVTLIINGEIEKQRVGSNAAGDLTRLLVYLANEGSRRTHGLRIGQWITTGSWTHVDFCAAQDEVEGRFTHSEPVRVRFA